MSPLGGALELLSGSFAQHAPLDGEDAIHPGRQPRIMGHHHQTGLALAIQFQHEGKDLRRIDAIQIAGGLIRQHHGRLRHQRPGDRGALALPA